ncbi:hypothetical protein G6F56_001576 [Rhizopus delemar]|uniref:Uncharacterized protein n=1 Tax=Rhizopus stolonifer TaxID=4846 RepID=A0A367KPC1_RHIST|nr:hypothetical protein G6F56_001576 [Rhizopus delemar]RCI03702.1 hypothetical protein CU098_002210 [Rhizopus stolonifer]
MHVSDLFKHKDKKDKEHHKDHHKDHHNEHKTAKPESDLPKGFYNDAMRNSNKPDTLYGFDDPIARKLGPVPSDDPTNTGA